MTNKKIILFAILAVAGIAIAYFLLPKNNENKIQTASPQQTTENKEAGVSVEVTPIDFAPAEPIKFQIAFTTHQGDLNFGLTKQAILYDGQNRQYLPISWDGGSGGHHLEGILIFPALTEETKNIKLIIKGVYDVPERIFEWNLN